MSFSRAHGEARAWVRAMAHRMIRAFVNHGHYPAIDGSYANLSKHPSARTEEYRREATAGSILLPLLAMVA